MQSELNFKTLSTEDKPLFEQLCMEKTLLEGWSEVRRNRGASGIDGQTIASFETRLPEEISRLKEELENLREKSNVGDGGISLFVDEAGANRVGIEINVPA